MADITGAKLTGAKMKAGSEEVSKEEGGSLIEGVGETLEKINLLK
jgi:hypothetical protein